MKERKIEEIIKKEKIFPVYEPVVSLTTGEVYGYEASSRIMTDTDTEDPSVGPLLMEAHVSGQLWDLERLCRRKALEGASGLPQGKKLFLNVSPNVIHDSQFKSGFTSKYLQEFGIISTDVIFELRASMAIEDMDGFKSAMNHYRRQGYEIALDDVGSDESGLGTMLDLAPNYVKLGCCMVRDIQQNHIKRALVKAFVRFANTSNIILVAQGVESLHELTVLAELGVHYAQGAYIGRPSTTLKDMPPIVRQQILELAQKPGDNDYEPLTLEAIVKNNEINTYIDAGNQRLLAMDYTEHSRVHGKKVSAVAGKILAELGYSEKEIELARIAGYMHDIGNCINRNDHAHTGGILAFQILTKMGIDPRDIAKIVGAIGNHDEKTGLATEPISAALIIADKTDVRRNRVRNKERTDFDIHDRVNYAAVSSELMIHPEKKEIILDLELDNDICSLMDYFEIFLDRMLMCRRAAEVLGCTFRLIANGSQVI